jgi:anti-sigma regulatory factor (Ser/Thr protein kinase)
MPELALHILDLVQNSIAAGAKRVTVTIRYDWANDMLTISIEDDGKGMDEELARRVTSPFVTTRTTRKVGLGIPMFSQLAQMCGGSLEISSTPGAGTKLTAAFRASHVDLPPMGSLRETILSLVAACPERPEFRFVYRVDDREFVFDTSEVRAQLGGLPLGEPEILEWIGEYVSEGIREADRSQ